MSNSSIENYFKNNMRRQSQENNTRVDDSISVENVLRQLRLNRNAAIIGLLNNGSISIDILMPSNKLPLKNQNTNSEVINSSSIKLKSIEKSQVIFDFFLVNGSQSSI